MRHPPAGIHGGTVAARHVRRTAHSLVYTTVRLMVVLTITACGPRNDAATAAADGGRPTASLAVPVPPDQPAAPSTSSTCAQEHGFCHFSGTRQVGYGTPARYVQLTLTGGTPCDNSVFGDPAPGVQKQCWYDTEPPPAPSTPSITETPGNSALMCSAPTEPTNAAPDGAMIEADTPGSDGTRMFPNGRPFVLTLTTRARASDSVAWQIVDAWSNVRASGRFEVASGPQAVALNCVSTLAGYFAVTASLNSAGAGLPSRGTRPAGIASFGILPNLSAVLPAPTYPREDLHRFGGQGAAYLTPGQHCCSGDGYRPLYPDLGLRWVNDNRNWYMMEPKGPNTFDASAYPLAPFFKPGDLMRLIQLDGIPAWASPTHAETHSYLPVSLPAYQSFMNRVGQESNQVRAQRFPKQARNYYQVTWEPDYNSGLPWRDTDANLVALYQATWQAIHATDPQAVIMGTTNASVATNTEWLQRLAPLGIAKYLDGVSIHGYYDVGTSPAHPPERTVGDSDPAKAAQSLPATMRALRRQIAATLHPGARLFVTETGISYDIGSHYGANYPTPNVLYAQGALVARTHLILLGEGADVTYLFYATDFPEQIGYGLFFDLVDAQGGFGPSAISPKPAAMATAAMTRVIDGTNTLGPVNGAPAGVYAYAFQQLNNGPVITALWTHNNEVWNPSKGFSSTYQVPYGLRVDNPGTSGQVTVLDMMGNPSTLNYSNGIAQLTLTEAPIYVISANAAVAKANVTSPAGYVAQ